MFNLFDADKDGFLGREEFQSGLCRLFGNTFEEKVRLVYDLFDFDLDGMITKEDIRTLLSHVPLAHLLDITKSNAQRESPKLQAETGRYLFLDRLESQEELVRLLERCMKSRTTLSFKEFEEMTEKESSTIFLCVSFTSHCRCSYC